MPHSNQKLCATAETRVDHHFRLSKLGSVTKHGLADYLNMVVLTTLDSSTDYEKLVHVT